ncbi:MAG: hypothetical protein P4L84_29045 [Isosphaeraceae bacterium]|nr:hypothetical protein [Isosphaeraceae bacterium]
MTKIAAALVCAATLLSLRARAGETGPLETSDRSAKILRSLDRVQAEIELAREQIDRLAREMQSLRAELAGERASDASVPQPAPGPPEVRIAGPITASAPQPLPGPGGVPIVGPVAVPPGELVPQNFEVEDRKTPRVYPINDPNFGSGEPSGSPALAPSSSLGAPPSFGEYLLVVAPDGNKVVAFEKTTRRSLPLTLSNDKTVRRRVTPVAGTAIVGLTIEGPKISRLAVFTNKNPGQVPAWHPVELREPVDSAVPEVEDYSAALYRLGRRVYAYSRQAERWDVLELPEGVAPRRGSGSNAGPTFEYDGHIYTFATATGKWTDLDTNAILDRAADPKK